MDLQGLRQIEDLIAKHRLEEAINGLELMDKEDLERNAWIAVSGRYHFLKQEYGAGGLPVGEYSTQMAQVSKELLRIVAALKKAIPRSTPPIPPVIEKNEEKLQHTAPPTLDIPELIYVAGGKYMRGCRDENDSDCLYWEKPAKEVKINAFEIGKTTVTNAQYCQFLNAKGNQEEKGVSWIDLDGPYGSEPCRIEPVAKGRFEVEPGYEQHPVVYVSWYGAKAYCNWLSSIDGDKTFRLPTEAEWEYAARGGRRSQHYKYAGSNTLDKVGLYDANSGNRLHKVAELDANELGIYDMSGNVWEWCNDWFADDYYEKGPTDNPQGPVDGSYRVHRGGSWGGPPLYCRVSLRNRWLPDGRLYDLGFRVAVSSQ
ncbi:MAG: SUMF1/EgtB/PvdO family nonheme iron enzyme [Saprospiraceae bacterium]|nr:SUMF1/EgtB/PvdO family nonheme iron enzyme [Saprospiraceae bacterium]